MTFIDLLDAYHIMPQFPPAVLREVEKMPTEVSDKDTGGRLDLTEKTIFTIDGDDAKDFDDAVSIELLDNNNFLLGVHIADVSHYVYENSAIDRSAYSRGTSVYLIDTVIPMLPFELSNELCSLKPNQKRLTISVFMEITPRGNVENYKIYESYISSCERMTYNNVTKILSGDDELCTRYSHLIYSLHNMKRLARILKKKRFEEGSVDFVTHESLITLDKDAHPIRVEKYPITESNGIIEEFMLVCNKTVALHLYNRNAPCIYRVHEKPDLMRLEVLSRILPVLGVEFNYNTDIKPKDFQSLLKSAEKSENFEVINYLALRSMAKAKYNEKNLGHFGLSFASYCHFTSPIRRYPDLVVHRILKKSLKGEIAGNEAEELKNFVIGAALSSSTSEINAQDAEIAWKNIKKCEYMADKVGEEHIGVITHVTKSGFFVELENTVEGFVPARTIEDDVYILAENGISLVGARTKRAFTIGDKVKIRVSAVDTEQGRIDFELEGARLNRIYKRTTKRKTDKKILRKIKEENNEVRSAKNRLRDKADFERRIFENAVIYTFVYEVDAFRKMKKTEKKFAEITVSDAAAMWSAPLYKSYLYETKSCLKESILAAEKGALFMLATLEDSFNISFEDDEKRLMVDFVKAALRHFDKSMQIDEMNRAKREHEYDLLVRKIKTKRKK